MEEIFRVLASIQENIAKIAVGIEEGNEAKRKLAHQMERLGNIADRQSFFGAHR